MATAKITILSDKMRGTSFTLINETYSVGRSDEADICLPEPTISGHHCTFRRNDDGNYFIIDEGSTNGTRINGEKLEEGNQVLLKEGDLVQLGNLEMMFENNDEHHTESRTMTVINLDDTGTVDVNPNATKSLSKNIDRHAVTLRDNKKHNIMFYAILGLLALLVCAGLAFFVFTIMGSKTE